MNIELASIPDFLQTGELYKILKEQDEPNVIIDPKFYIIDYDEEQSIETFAGIMETIRYWGVEQLPDFVYHYILLHSALLYQYPPYLNAITNTQYQRELEYIQIPLNIQYCIANRFNGIVKYVISNIHKYETDILYKEPHHNFPECAAKFGNMEILQFLDEQNYIISHQTLINTIIYRQPQCFQYLSLKHAEQIRRNSATSSSQSLIKYTIEYNQIETAKLILNLIDTQSKIFTKLCTALMQECVSHSTFEIFALIYPYWQNIPTQNRNRNIMSVFERISKHRQFVFLKYMYEKEQKWHPDAANILVSHGYMEALQYAVENGCEYGSITLAIAAYYGNIDCIKYLIEKGAEWSHLVSEAAAENDNIICLEYLVENGCPVSKKTIEIIRLNGHNEFVEYIENYSISN